MAAFSCSIMAADYAIGRAFKPFYKLAVSFMFWEKFVFYESFCLNRAFSITSKFIWKLIFNLRNFSVLVGGHILVTLLS